MKLIYVPNGEYFLFESVNSNELTTDYNQSGWKSVWNDPEDMVISHLCKIENELDSKIRHHIPTGIELSPAEFMWTED